MMYNPELRVGRLAEGRVLLLLAESGAGKTRAHARLFNKYEEFKNHWDKDSDRRLISVKAPSPCTLKQLGDKILAATGYISERELAEQTIWKLIPLRLKALNIRYLHIDEAQHPIEEADKNSIKKVRNTLKALLQDAEWPIWILLSGKPLAGDLLDVDAQMFRRRRVVQFDAVTIEKDGEILKKIFHGTIRGRAGLNIDETFPDSFYARLLHASHYQFGTAVEFVQDAILEAFEAGDEAVGLRHFRDVYKARSGCQPDMNVFTAPEYHAINVAKALEKDVAVLDVEQIKRPRVQRKS